MSLHSFYFDFLKNFSNKYKIVIVCLIGKGGYIDVLQMHEEEDYRKLQQQHRRAVHDCRTLQRQQTAADITSVI